MRAWLTVVVHYPCWQALPGVLRCLLSRADSAPVAAGRATPVA